MPKTSHLPDLAATVGTPFYCYSSAALEANYRAFADAFAGTDTGICYALKANSNLAVIRTLAKLGAGADVVSEGEMRRALAGGIPADRIVFSGVGKTRDEMRAALEAGIFQLNVESIPELEALSQVASSLDRTASIAIRVNPDVDAKTHAKIATGKKENKFGIDFDHARADLCPRRRASRHQARRGRRPYRIAAHQPGTLPRRLRAGGGTGPCAARGRPRYPAPGPRRRPRHPVPGRGRAGARCLCRHGQEHHRQSRLPRDAGARPRPCRQRRHPGVEGDLPQDRACIGSS